MALLGVGEGVATGIAVGNAVGWVAFVGIAVAGGAVGGVDWVGAAGGTGVFDGTAMGGAAQALNKAVSSIAATPHNVEGEFIRLIWLSSLQK